VIRLGYVFCRLALTVCLATSIGASAQSEPQSFEPIMKGKSVYIYDFLDIRKRQFGDAFFDIFESKLTDGLTKYGLDTKVIRFSKTRAGGFYSSSDQINTYQSGSVPVEQVINDNIPEERSFNSSYRIIAFPLSYTVSQMSQSYDIRWVVEDVSSGKQVLDFTYHGKNMILFSTKENPEGRASKLVNHFLEELRAKGLI